MSSIHRLCIGRSRSIGSGVSNATSCERVAGPPPAARESGFPRRAPANAALVLHLRQRRAQRVATHLKQLAQRALARQPVAPFAVFNLRIEKRDRLRDEGLALG